MESSTSAVIERVFADLGVRSFRPTGWKMLVLTDAPPSRTEGGVWFPADTVAFYKAMPHAQLVNATVIAVGPKTRSVRPNDRVVFQRLHFIRWQRVGDATSPEQYAGWVDERNLVGFEG